MVYRSINAFGPLLARLTQWSPLRQFPQLRRPLTILQARFARLRATPLRHLQSLLAATFVHFPAQFLLLLPRF